MHMKVVPTGCQGGLPVQPAARRQAPDAHHLLQLAGREGAMLVYSLAVLSCVLGACVLWVGDDRCSFYFSLEKSRWALV